MILSDSKDVYFQKNPLEAIHQDPFLFLFSEGFQHRQSEWNINDQIKAQVRLRDFSKNCLDWPVVNSGFIIGTFQEVKQLAFLIWSCTLMNGGNCTDQAILNYLVQYLKDDPVYKIHEPTNNLLVATGEAVSQKLMQPDPYFQEGKLYCSLVNKPYFVFHQWDRTIYKNDILRLFYE